MRSNARIFSSPPAAPMLRELPPRDLFARCASIPNDEPAWSEFLRRYRQHVHAAIYRILGNPPAGRYYHLLPDALQCFHLRLLKNNRRALFEFRGEREESAQAYLRKIAARAALRILPHAGRFKLPLEILEEASHGAHMLALSQARGMPEDYLALLHDLDAGLDQILHGRKKYRNMLILKLHFCYGLSSQDLAQILGLQVHSRHAIEQLVYRARRKLAPLLSAKSRTIKRELL